MITFLIVGILVVIFFDRGLLGLAVIGTISLLILDGLTKVISNKKVWYVVLGLLIIFIFSGIISKL